MTYIADGFYYLLLLVLVAIPFILLFHSVQTLRHRKITPPDKQKQTQTIRIITLVLSLVYVGLIGYPFLYYLEGGFAQDQYGPTAASMPPFGQMILATAFVGFLGLLFLGSIIAASLLTIRSLENPKK